MSKSSISRMLIKELHNIPFTKKNFLLNSVQPKKTKKKRKKTKTQTSISEAKKIRITNASVFFSSTNLSKKRTKNVQGKKWNDATAKELQKELERLRSIKEEDPNSFDRFAIK